ncbi:MAG TPA: dolichyl-phosphate beta-glucosyltransferase [Chloroflexia bacterium]|nr:dolichyl-phosphate beta-glucosyltransferase [Chloroflexia bacterium]
MSTDGGKRARPEADLPAAADAPLLTVVIPAYNEAARLPASLTRIEQYLSQQSYPYELIVVDDGSSDDTATLAEQFAANNPYVRVIRNPHMGKGVTVRTGMLAGTGRYILYSDTDLSTPIEELAKLLSWLDKGYDIAIGSREGQGAVRYNEPGYRHLMGRVFNKFVQLVALRQFKDTQCGFKAFRHAASEDLFRAVQIYGDKAGPVKGAMVTGFDVEVLYLALKRRYRVKEVPVRWYYASGSKVSPMRDSLRLLRDVFQVRWNDMRGKYGSARPRTPSA